MSTKIDTNTRGQGHRLPGRNRWRTVVSVLAGAAMVIPAAVTYQNQDYQENLQMIKSQSFRNTNHDNSPYRDTKQSELVQANHLGPRSDYPQNFPVVNGGQFRVNCEFSHFAYDDPILFPDQPGAAHLHTFFGNTDVNAFTTQETLEDSGSSTCNGQELNRSGYWVPTMIDSNGNARVPIDFLIYYKGEGFANGGPNGNQPTFPNGDPNPGSQPYERGMRNIAASPNNSIAQLSNAQGGADSQTNFLCTDNFSNNNMPGGSSADANIPNCDGSGNTSCGSSSVHFPNCHRVLEMEVKFWNCWSQGNNQYEDWTGWIPGFSNWFASNCNGKVTGQGPTDAEIYPSMSYFVKYGIELGENTSDWYLSSDVDPSTINNAQPSLRPAGAGNTHHGDVWWSWDPDTNQQWLDNCVNYKNPSGAASGCASGFLTDGGPDGTPGNRLPGPALNYSPEFAELQNVTNWKTPVAAIFNELCQPLGPAHTYSTDMHAAWCKP